MSIKQGEYLKKLRTDRKLSQDKLSEILSISRQSISKWEQGVSSPDIENTQKLAEYYGVSIDSIVKGEDDSFASIIEGVENQENAQAKMPKQPMSEILSDFSQTKSHNESKNEAEAKAEKGKKGKEKKKKKRGAFFCSYPIITIIIYCLLGIAFSPRGWYMGWVVLLTIPLFYTGVIAFEKKKPVIFCYPVLVLLIYLLLGFSLSVWHPAWIIFLTIPIFYIFTARK